MADQEGTYSRYCEFELSSMRNYNRPAGKSPVWRDVSPQFVEGSRNQNYISPTFQSSVFTSYEDRRVAQDRLRTTNRDQFGAEIYRKTVYNDRTDDGNERSKSRNIPRHPGMPVDELNRAHPRYEGYESANFARPNEEREEAQSHHSEPRNEAPAKSETKSVRSQPQEQVIQPEPVPQGDYDHADNGNAPFGDRVEDQQAAEERIKKDYRKNLDDYHRFVAEKNLQNSSRVNQKREEAALIKERAEMIAEEKRAEAQWDKERKRQYNEQLQEQQYVQHNVQTGQRNLPVESAKYFNNSTTSEHRRKEKNQRPIMKKLQSELQGAFQFRKRLDELTKSQNVEDFLKYKDYFDQVHKELVLTL